jgi:hypothetical protein
MPELYLAKSAGGILVPIDQPTADYIDRFALDDGFVASVRQYNNVKFHRKLFALFKLAFDAWNPGELQYKGEIVHPTFDRFRRDLTILAGYYETTIDLLGRVRLEARSLNFSDMEQPEREALFSRVVDVVLQRILTRYTRADLDNVLAQLMEFTR